MLIIFDRKKINLMNKNETRAKSLTLETIIFDSDKKEIIKFG